MLYEIVLKDGNTVRCYGENQDELLRMFIEDNILVVQENSEVDRVTFILRDNVSFMRLSTEFKYIVKPVI